MYPVHKCLNCGRIWASRDMLVVCPVCRCKPIKMKEEEIVKLLQEGEKHKQIIDKLKNRWC